MIGRITIARLLLIFFGTLAVMALWPSDAHACTSLTYQGTATQPSDECPKAPPTIASVAAGGVAAGAAASAAAAGLVRGAQAAQKAGLKPAPRAGKGLTRSGGAQRDGRAPQAYGKHAYERSVKNLGPEPGLSGVSREPGNERVDREVDRWPVREPIVAAAQELVVRADIPHNVRPPEIVGDYYPGIPPTTQVRYFVRDQSNPIPVFDGPPARDQVSQGTVGDCGILAALGGVAAHRPDVIRNAIKQVGDGQYEVAMHEVVEATPADPVARPTGAVKTFRVNDELPVRTDTPKRSLAGAQAETCGWGAILEKVIAAEDQTWTPAKKTYWGKMWRSRYKHWVDQERGKLRPSPIDPPMGYNRLDMGSTPYQQADLLAKLTGENAEVCRIPGERHGERVLLDELRDRLGAGKPVIVSTRGLRVNGEQLPDGIESGHAYEVTRIWNGKIHVYNPWGFNHPAPMDARTFWEYYRHYNQDGTRYGYYATLE